MHERNLLESSAASRKLRKSFDFFPNDLNSSLVGGVQLQDPLFVHVAEELSRCGENRGGFAGTRRSVEQKIRKVPSGQTLSENLDDFSLFDDILDGLRSTDDSTQEKIDKLQNCR